MADDIFLTPEEQDERAKKWLKDNGMSIAVGIALGLAGVFAYNQYNDNLDLEAEQASGLYDAILNAHETSQISDIDVQVEELKKEYASTSYAAKAVLVKAKQLAVSDQESALRELQWVIDNAPEVGLQHTARVRLAKLNYVLGNTDAARELASVQPSNGFDSHYQEILGDIERKQGNHQTARGHYEKATESLGAGNNTYAQVLAMKLSRLPNETSTDEVGATAVEAADSTSAEALENTAAEALENTPAEALEAKVNEFQGAVEDAAVETSASSE